MVMAPVQDRPPPTWARVLVVVVVIILIWFLIWKGWHPFLKFK